MSMKRRGFFVLLFLLCLFVSYHQGYGFSQQEAEKDAAQLENAQEKIVASPRNIREKIGIYVFLVWMWLVVGIAIYTVRLKIKEADRLHAMRFFSDERE
jgi:hypothetical protein